MPRISLKDTVGKKGIQKKRKKIWIEYASIPHVLIGIDFRKISSQLDTE